MLGFARYQFLIRTGHLFIQNRWFLSDQRCDRLHARRCPCLGFGTQFRTMNKTDGSILATLKGHVYDATGARDSVSHGIALFRGAATVSNRSNRSATAATIGQREQLVAAVWPTWELGTETGPNGNLVAKSLGQPVAFANNSEAMNWVSSN